MEKTYFLGNNLKEKWLKFPVIRRISIIILSALSTGALSILTGKLVETNKFINSLDDRLFIQIYHLPHNPLINKIIFPFDLWFFKVQGLNMPAYFYLYLGLFLIYILITRRRYFFWALLAVIIG